MKHPAKREYAMPGSGLIQNAFVPQQNLRGINNYIPDYNVQRQDFDAEADHLDFPQWQSIGCIAECFHYIFRCRVPIHLSRIMPLLRSIYLNYTLAFYQALH